MDRHAAHNRPMVLVVMGVSSSGKTTVGKLLAERLDWHYLEGDALHPPENVAKMSGGTPLTDPSFASIWQAIDQAKLPVLIHPTAPPGVAEMEMAHFQLVASIGFTTDTTLAVARMIYDGFFDRFEKLRIIASHGGGTLPYLIGRMDQCYEHIPACRTKTREKPSLHARRVYADAVVFTDDALAMAVNVFGSGNVLYGSDYPHTIGDPIGCLARVDRLPDGVRERVRGRNSERIFDFR